MSRRLLPGDTLVIATHNPGKLAEIGLLLAPYGLRLIAAGAMNLPEPDETEADFAGNARLKALAAARVANLPALADDSGFCVAALAGAPGIYSARWAGPNKDFSAAMRRVHHDASSHPDHRAWFICALCLAWPDGASATFLGRIDGARIWPPRGTRGFGYDPMFVPTGGTLSYGEMEPAEKETDSHRARAFAQLVGNQGRGAMPPNTTRSNAKFG